MPLQTRVGQLTRPAATGVQNITGLGFRPKAILFWTFGAPGEGWTTANAYSMWGMTAGPGKSYVQAGYSSNAQAVAQTSRWSSDQKPIALVFSSAGSLWVEADIQSFDGDGFSLNWTRLNTTEPAAFVINYLAIGGAEIQAALQTTYFPTTNTNIIVAGVGFKPDMAFLACTADNIPSVNPNHSFSLGVVNSSAQQGSYSMWDSYNIAPSSTYQYLSTDSALVVGSPTTVAGRLILRSMDDDGLTFAPSPTLSSDREFAVLALKGVTSKIGTFKKPVTTGTYYQSVSRHDFNPKAAFFFTANWGRMASPGVNAIMPSIGAASAPTAQGAAPTQGASSMYSKQAANPTVTAACHDTGSIIRTFQDNGTGNSSAFISSFNSDGFTLRWAANSYDPEISYVSLGDATPLPTYPSAVDAYAGDILNNYVGKRLDRSPDGTVLWSFQADATDQNGYFFSSSDNGRTWAQRGFLAGAHGAGSMHIDADGFIHVAWKQLNYGGSRTASTLYYSRGTVAADLSITWGQQIQFQATTTCDYPDLIAHKGVDGDGGYYVHIVDSYAPQNSTNYVDYYRIRIDTSNVATRTTIATFAGSYGNNNHTFPSIDFNHTGDGKTIKNGRPDVYVAWSTGAGGPGKGLRYRKVRYERPFTYTGSPQTYVVPAGVTTIDAELFGAQGGAPSGTGMGMGGWSKATIPVTPGETLNIYVGGQGLGGNSNAANSLGGFNGGGNGYMSSTTQPTYGFGGSGGGATDIRQGGTALSNRTLIAGGGGGHGSNSGAGQPAGTGGGVNGQDAPPASAAGGFGGTQTAGGLKASGSAAGNGALGVGGGGDQNTTAAGGGGGGGYYGGGGGACATIGGSGGGGSGYVTGTNTAMANGLNSGHGRAILRVNGADVGASPTWDILSLDREIDPNYWGYQWCLIFDGIRAVVVGSLYRAADQTAADSVIYDIDPVSSIITGRRVLAGIPGNYGGTYQRCDFAVDAQKNVHFVGPWYDNNFYYCHKGVWNRATNTFTDTIIESYNPSWSWRMNRYSNGGQVEWTYFVGTGGNPAHMHYDNDRNKVPNAPTNVTKVAETAENYPLLSANVTMAEDNEEVFVRFYVYGGLGTAGTLIRYFDSTTTRVNGVVQARSPVAFTTSDTYLIRARAIDQYGALSPLSDPYTLSMTYPNSFALNMQWNTVSGVSKSLNTPWAQQSRVFTKVGTFANNATVGTQAITGVGFQPKAIIIWTAATGASGTFSGHQYASIGLATSATNQYAFGMAEADGQATPNSRRSFSNAKVIYTHNTAGSGLWFDAALVSMDADGFTLNFLTQAFGSMNFHYLAIGGAAVNAKVVQWLSPASTTNISIAGVGFKPDLVFNAGSNTNLAPPSNEINASLTFGVMNSLGQQWSNTVGGLDLVTANTSRFQQTDAADVAVVGGEVQLKQGHLVSMDADGFTMKYSVADTYGRYRVSLCLQGVGSKISAFPRSKAAAPTTDTVVANGLAPRAVLFSWSGGAALSAPAAHTILGIGASDGTAQVSSVTFGVDNVNPSQEKTGWWNNASIIEPNIGASPTVASLGTTALNNDGFVVTWNPSNTGGQMEVVYVTIGDNMKPSYPVRVQ